MAYISLWHSREDDFKFGGAGGGGAGAAMMATGRFPGSELQVESWACLSVD